MRVLIAHSFYRASGGEDQCVRDLLHLLRQRHDVQLLGKLNRDLRNSPSTAMRMLYSTRLRRHVERIFQSFRPHVVHLHNSYPSLGPAVFLAAEKLRVPLVMTAHNYRLRCPNGYMFTAGSVCNRCERGGYHNAVLHPCFAARTQSVAYASSLWFHRFVLNLEETVSIFVCPSEFMRTTLESWGIPTEKLRLIRNFTKQVPDVDPTPGQYGAYVGRLSSEKGLHILLPALRNAGNPPFRILGDGPESTRLRRMSEQLGLTSTRFEGRASPSQVDRVLRSARFVVLPSVWHENAPLAALEAMSRGRALIVSGMGGLPELAQDGRGRIARAGDVTDLANQVRLFMGNVDECRSAGARALAFAEEELSPERHLTQLEQTYRGLIS